MGGSGIAGDVARRRRPTTTLPVPVVVLKQNRVPRFVGPRTLAFAVSYSGDTEETAADGHGRARSRRARSSPSSRRGDWPTWPQERGAVHVPCPDGYLPRAAVGALAGSAVRRARAGRPRSRTPGEWLDAGTDASSRTGARSAGRDVDGPANPAREIARKIGTTIPIFYGGGALGAVAAQRWKCDVNENAKAPAFWNAYPELDHNEICGWGQHGDVTRQLFTLVELRHGFEHEQLERRVRRSRAS